jgi:tetratricopeptide (TPR) repeat protein
MKTRRVALAAVASCLVGFAQGAQAGWLRLDVDGYPLIGDVSEKRLQLIASDLRFFRFAIGRYITSTPSGDALPIMVYAVSDDLWEDNVRPRPDLAGIFVPGAFQADVLLDAEGGWERSRMVVYHEYTHYYIHNLDKFPYPTWFHEGLAQFMAPTIRDGKELLLGRMPYGNWLGLNDWIPMSRLLVVDNSSPEYLNHSGQSQFYGESWLFMHYLLVDSLQRRDGINRLLSQMVNGADPASATQAAFGASPEALDAELQAYYRKQKFRVIPIPAPEKLEKVKTAAVPMSEAAALREVALATLRGGPDDAERVIPLLRRALELAPDDKAALAGLATALERTGKTTEADAAMEKASQPEVKDAVALRLCGEYYATHAAKTQDEPASEKSLADARQCYVRAIEANPGDYQSLVDVVLGTTEPSAEDTAKWMSALEQAQARYPQSEYVSYALSRTYFENGQHEKALAMLKRAAESTRDPVRRRTIANQLRVMSLMRAVPEGE